MIKKINMTYIFITFYIFISLISISYQREHETIKSVYDTLENILSDSYKYENNSFEFNTTILTCDINNIKPFIEKKLASIDYDNNKITFTEVIITYSYDLKISIENYTIERDGLIASENYTSIVFNLKDDNSVWHSLPSEGASDFKLGTIDLFNYKIYKKEYNEFEKKIQTNISSKLNDYLFAILRNFLTDNEYNFRVFLEKIKQRIFKGFQTTTQIENVQLFPGSYEYKDDKYLNLHVKLNFKNSIGFYNTNIIVDKINFNINDIIVGKIFINDMEIDEQSKNDLSTIINHCFQTEFKIFTWID